MLPEIPEKDATGRTAEIYDIIRQAYRLGMGLSD